MFASCLEFKDCKKKEVCFFVLLLLLLLGVQVRKSRLDLWIILSQRSTPNLKTYYWPIIVLLFGKLFVSYYSEIKYKVGGQKGKYKYYPYLAIYFFSSCWNSHFISIHSIYSLLFYSFETEE